jgi:hypothetical protein
MAFRRLDDRAALDIPAKRLEALYTIAREARELVKPGGHGNGGTRTVLSKNALRGLRAAVEQLDEVKDGPVWECRRS